MDDVTRTEPGGRVLGWLSGLGLVVVPWVGAGVLSTVAGVLGSDAWDPERTFGWWLLLAFLVMVGWLVIGSVRIAGFRRGAVRGAVVSLAGWGLVLALVWLLRP
jgi:hypothetical protein